MAYKRINDVTRARVIALLFAGEAPAQISEETGVSEATISRLKRKIPDTVLKRFDEERRSLEIERADFESERNSLPTLIEKFLYANFRASTKIMEQVYDDEWRNRQTANDLAVFFGVACDKSFRILEAMERAEERKAEETKETLRQLPDPPPSSVL